MKRILLAAAAALCLMSCEKTAMDTIRGTWEATTVEMTMEGLNMSFDLEELEIGLEFTFRSDGKGSLTDLYDGDSVTRSFEYDYDGNILSLTVDNETYEIPAVVSDRNMTLSLDGKLLDEEEFDGLVKMNFIKK
jgi:hypothetical protein